MPSPKRVKLTIRDKAKASIWLAKEVIKGTINVKKISSKNLEAQMKEEIDRYNKGKKTNEELMKEKFPEPEWFIEDNT